MRNNTRIKLSSPGRDRFHALWRALPLGTRRALAKSAGTTVGYLQQYANGFTALSADKAGVLAKVLKRHWPAWKALPGLTPLTRGDLCDVCRRCDYFKRGSAHE